MTTGISIQHVRAVAVEDREVCMDHAGFLAVIPPTRWPQGARTGDVVRLPLEGTSVDRPAADPATSAAVRAFFANGGVRCTVFGVCVGGEEDLVVPGRVDDVLSGALDQLAHDDDVSLLVAPALAWLPHRGAAVGAHAAAVALLRHCREVGQRFLLLDAPRGADERATVAWVRQLRAAPGVDASWGAIHFPWLQVGDRAVPPSGAVAGVHARTIRAHAPDGVRVAPANVELAGFTHAQIDLSWRSARRLVEQGVNPILVQSGRGLVLAGARTLSADPAWRQIVARRIVSLVTERVRRDAEWVVFEQLRPELWASVERRVRARLDACWASGLLTGAVEGEEYRVRCDAELNPVAVRDAGQVHLRVQLRPVTATERVEIALQVGR